MILASGLTRTLFGIIVFEHDHIFSIETIYTIISYITLAITMVIVAVPEGLPLAVSICLAYSVSRMKDDNILVKSLIAPETMGGVDCICTGKSGTLTRADMKVMAFYTQ